jgi:hypothetical protein
MGLEQDDPVVRRRLSQKVQFILDTGSESGVPTDAELQAWLEANPERYRVEATYALNQHYFDPDRHGERIESIVAQAQRALAAGRPATGDPTMLPAELEGRATEIERTFGPEFELALRDLPVGGWQGPVRSAFGLHLVELTARTNAREASLAEARPEVARDRMEARAESAQEALYQGLRAKYAVRIEPEAPAG